MINFIFQDVLHFLQVHCLNVSVWCYKIWVLIMSLVHAINKKKKKKTPLTMIKKTDRVRFTSSFDLIV